MPKSEVETWSSMTDMKFLPGGRYLYYAGRDETRYYNNCFLLKCKEDTRQDWATITQKATRRYAAACWTTASITPVWKPLKRRGQDGRCGYG